MKRKIIRKGKVLTIHALCNDDSPISELEEFLNKINEKDRMMILNKLETAANNIYMVRNTNFFKYLDEYLYEFRHKRYRLLTYNESNNVEMEDNKKLVILFAFIKKSKAEQNRYINKAKRIIDKIKQEGWNE